MNVISTPNGYDEVTEFLSQKWGWQKIDNLPSIELKEITGDETPAKRQLLMAGIFSGGYLCVLKDTSDCYYTAWCDHIPFKDSWEDEEYTAFGVFIDSVTLHQILAIH